jgi:hypothetical protein
MPVYYRSISFTASPAMTDAPPPLAEDKYEPFAHYHQEHLGIDINTRTMTVLWPIYKRLACCKYLKENCLAPIVWRKSAKRAAHVLGVLRSVGDISPIGTFLAMRLQWLLHDAFKALPTKASFATGFNSSQAKDPPPPSMHQGTHDRTWPSSVTH